MTVPPPTDVSVTSASAFGVPPDFNTTVPIGKPNWIQDAEAIAKADINRLEGKFKRFCSSLTASLAISIAALLVGCLALFKSCH